MARYIDADKCPCKGCGISYCNENCKKYYAWLEGCDYDVEAVVAELEKESKEYEKRADENNVDTEYTRYYAISEGLDKAISIVRGKE